jgi:predicted nucleotidyltransferase
LKGLKFEDAFKTATIEEVDGIAVRIIHLNQLIEAKKAAGRYKDLNDIENLPTE